jgi:7-cyano-7-deazaguanine reductase
MTEDDVRRSPAYDGRQDGIRDLALPPIEVWENKYADRAYEVELVVGEFNSICPLTGLPDFGTVTIRYAPARWCAELKAFKLYVTAYRTVGIFQEHAANRILDDFVEAVRPRWADLEAVFNVRGGIKTVVRCSWRPGA